MKANSYLRAQLREQLLYLSQRNWIPDQVRDDTRVSKILLVLGLLLTLVSTNTFAQSVTPTSAPAYTVIINQIRGESCCSPGNLENTRTQLENAVKYELPTTFVLRYDALTDSRYTDLILSYQRLHPTLIQTGVMVEIIPSLITDSNKQYCSNQKFETLNSKFEHLYEGQRAISGAEMSEESNNDRVPDEFIREEIGCCHEIASSVASLTPRNDVHHTTEQKILNQVQDDTKQTPPPASLEREPSGHGRNDTDATCKIEYEGSSETWFQAQNAFTIGYPFDARTMILDTLLSRYQIIFGTYPKVSSAWMIDTDSVNYLHERYGVITQQITREQWGTDSYTLYGGPPHYPYPASRNWIFMPDYTNVEAVTIVRQTVTDPLYNYGDTSSTYTSQPNDYMRAGRGIAYFQTLIDTAILQQSTGFANIGLENSMDTMYQDEYTNQLAYIAKLRDEDRLAVVFPDAVGPIFQNQNITTYARTDGDRQAIWITTPHYRARIIRKDGGISLTDLRIYSKELKDPYATRVAKHEGYWVAPFLVDGSRWYEKKGVTMLSHAFLPIQNDFFSNPSRIEFVDSRAITALRTSHTLDEISIRDTDGSHLTTFSVNHYKIFLPIHTVLYSPRDFPVKIDGQGFQWMTEGAESWSMYKLIEACGTSCRDTTTFGMKVQPQKYARALDVQYPYVLPEAVGRDLGMQYTRVSVNNTFAIAGRNPVRLVLEPHDAMNFPIILDKEAEITVDPDDTAVSRLGKLISSQHQYVDLDRSDPRQVDVTVKMTQRGKEYVVRNIVFFAPNCKKDWSYCLTHPLHGVWYLLTQISDRLAGRK